MLSDMHSLTEMNKAIISENQKKQKR